MFMLLLTRCARSVARDQFQYIKIQSKTIDFNTRLLGINPTNSVVIPMSLILRSVVLGWIFIYWNWSMKTNWIALHVKSVVLITSHFIPKCPLWQNTLRYLSKREIIQERLELFKDINGNAFFPVKWWPKDMQLTFWKKPIGNSDTFKLVLFLLGNGCSPHPLKRCIMLSQFWAEHPTAEKRARQIDFILNNADSKGPIWFY